MIITIAGLPGSGKTTVATMLSERLGVPWVSIGDMRGKMAQGRNLTIDQLNLLGEKDFFTDQDVDEFQKKLGKTRKDYVVEGRLSWFFIPHSFKVFLDVDPEIGAKRVLEASKRRERPDERRYLSLDEAREHIQYRLASDQRRYQKYYSVDTMNKANYDLIVDTSALTPEEVFQTILDTAKGKGFS